VPLLAILGALACGGDPDCRGSNQLDIIVNNRRLPPFAFSV